MLSFRTKKKWKYSGKRWGLIEPEDKIRPGSVYFGGSFNPIHNGHILLLQALLDYRWVNDCFVVPTSISPFKTVENGFQPYELRLQWVKAALEGLSGIQVSHLESPDETPPGDAQSFSYTCDTLERFYDVYRHYPYLAIGEDSLRSFHRWKNWESILRKTELIVFRREHSVKEPGNQVRLNFPDKVHFLQTPIFEISSTEIRERIRRGKSIRGYVPFQLEQEITRAYR